VTSVTAWYHKTHKTLIIRAPQNPGTLVDIAEKCPVATAFFNDAVGVLIVSHPDMLRAATIARYHFSRHFPGVGIDESGLSASIIINERARVRTCLASLSLGGGVVV
jgi:hypothetical protein